MLLTNPVGTGTLLLDEHYEDWECGRGGGVGDAKRVVLTQLACFRAWGIRLAMASVGWNSSMKMFFRAGLGTHSTS